MTPQELFTYLTDGAGLDEATTKIIMDAAKNEKVAAKAQLLKDQKEYESLVQELDGAAGKPGTRAYAKWYQDNYATIQATVAAKSDLEKKVTQYQERYGSLEAPTTPPKGTPVLDDDAITRLVDQRIQTQYGPQWSTLLKSSGKLIERHLKAGRKTDIDWDKIAEVATTKNGDLVAAYDEWDKPEQEKSAKAAEDVRVETRVQVELQKRQMAETRKQFPSGADATPSDSPLSRHTGENGKPPAYDRSKVIEAAVTGNYDGYAGASNGKSRPGADFFQ